VAYDPGMVPAVAILASAVISAVANPVVAARDGQVRLSVYGLRAPAASVHLNGGIASGGRWFGWVSLRDDGGGTWSTTLRAPGYLGVYPVFVRTGGVTRPTDEVVSVLPRHSEKQPGFDTPEQVARWWARQAPSGASVESVTTWRSGFFTHRDPGLNRLLRVRFSLHGEWPAKHLGQGAHELFLSVARLRPDGRWRLLETASAP
jgi:hypothetical protein